jgi:MFS family permease
MKFTTNLKLSDLVSFCTYFFISGADGYIILPTAWYYIQSLGFTKTFYGAVLAAQSLGFILLSPVAGKFADKGGTVKFILLLCSIVKVIAYLIYAIPASGYCPLVGSFLSGAANSVYGGIYGEVVRHTKEEHRSKLFLLLDSMFFIGACCGPVFGSLITFKANIFGWNIYNGNSPAIVLAITWFVTVCIVIFLQRDSGTREISNEIGQLGKDNCKPDGPLINSTICCVLCLVFSNTLVSTTSTGILPLLTMELFHLKLIHVKLVFGVGMIFVLLTYLVTYMATTRFSERGLLVSLSILQMPSIILLCIYVFVWTNVPFWLSYTLVIFACFGMPQVCSAVSGALLSKITPSQHASTVQSLFFLQVFISILVGRGTWDVWICISVSNTTYWILCRSFTTMARWFGVVRIYV